MSFTIYRLENNSMVEVASVNDDGTVDGATPTADYMRGAFEKIRDYDVDPADHLSGIRDRLKANWQRTGYYHIS